MHVVFSYFNNEDEDLNFFENELNKSLDRYYELYLSFFTLLFSLNRYAADVTELRRRKFIATEEERNPNMRFINNRVISDLSKMLQNEKTQIASPIVWEDYPELLKKNYSTLISSEEYRDYMNHPEDSYRQDKQIVYFIYEKLLPENLDLFSVLEDKSIFWNDDVEFVLSMNLRTIQRMKETKGGKNTLLPMYKTEEDKVFAQRLLQQSILKREEYIKIISETSTQWEFDRMAIIDRVILCMAITEILEFPTIPVAVTLDEYIEIAKYYSTEKSSIFVNGILERIMERLVSENRVSRLKLTN